MNKKILALTLACVLMLSLLAACTKEPADPVGGDATDPVTKVAVVFATGGLGDKSFNDSVYDGIMRAKNELGIDVQYVEPKEVAEFEGHNRDFARSKNYDLIVAIGFDQADPLSVVAEEFPEQKFLLIDGYLEAPNVKSVTFKDFEKAFLIGSIAAEQTTTNKIGFVGGMDIPLINAFLAGYKAGAAYVNPDCEVSAVYVGAWNDVNTGKELALSLYDKGNDIVWAAAGGSGLGVFEAAKTSDKLAIGADVNQIYLGPKNIFLSSQRMLGNVIFDQIKAVKEGNFETGTAELGLKENALSYTTDGAEVKVDSAIITATEDIRAKIIEGEIVVPTTLEEADAFIADLK